MELGFKMHDLFHIPIKTIQGETITLEPHQSKVLLIVNVASRCGFTPQYKALEALYQRYQSQGLVILGFPCNQFKHQEPGDNKEIAAFAKSCFRVTFPMFAKMDVKGSNQSPLYHYLQHHLCKKPWFFVPWNFTKILIDKKGQVIQQFYPFISMKSVEKKIQALLAQSSI